MTAKKPAAPSLLASQGETGASLTGASLNGASPHGASPNGVALNGAATGIGAREVAALFEAMRGRLIVVLGDLMLDEWISGTTTRISPEAPVPIVRVTERRTAPGGAANVAMNLLKLGARVRLVGVVGADWAGAEMARELEEAGVDVAGLVQDDTRPTVLKTRVVAQSQQQSQQMVRVDRESDAPLPRPVVAALRQRLSAAWDDACALCVSDYDKGLATSGALNPAIEEAIGRGLCVTGGPKPLNLACFHGVDFLSLNQYEAGEAAGIRLDTREAIECAGEALRQQLEARALAVTFSSRGVWLFEENQTPHHIAARAVEVFDGTGAGDTFLAGATAALAGGASCIEAGEVGNLAAAASVRHVGVVAVTPDEVCHAAAAQ